MKTNKVSIIGAGFVGSTTAFALMNSNIASEIVIVDINKEKAQGEAMDLDQGRVFVSPVKIIAGDYPETQGSDIVIITAGLAQKPGETRIDLVNRNIKIYEELVPNIVKYNPDAILLVVSNPVDILTHITYKLSGFPAERVIGSGTVLDTARFQSMLANKFEVDARNIHANIIGEHGDSEIATWSLTTVAGLTIDQYCENVGIEFTEETRQKVTHDVKTAAYEIIDRKGYTNYAVALAITRIVNAILRDENSILTVSSLQDGAYGIEDVYISVPTVVGRTGVKHVIEVPYSSNEVEALQESAEMLRDIVSQSNL
ncbi:L-lactate dehydrogenase [Erysipelothrix rhusiopathiae]|nr:MULTISPECIES: L-lactate dehydrogenase [Erysipelothrix]CAH2760835.1 L-lactate dehydrogenase [Erysipelothrix sp. A18Y020d]AGN25086.1 L-lactate dehydrogenase [Erysipelothrix rhusiopathiae SY1027]AWU40766.1 L-lactate dehydrogenase [Erysipelothrix rhusiopathiae]AYV35310.1 L-lactate dehydrogenase [Erysipelothrix rhusiopathiae]MCG4436890.1 L-lactate dehydrogenase [Erysipelothrix rhusiopathiae]